MQAFSSNSSSIQHLAAAAAPIQRKAATAVPFQKQQQSSILSEQISALSENSSRAVPFQSRAAPFQRAAAPFQRTALALYPANCPGVFSLIWKAIHPPKIIVMHCICRNYFWVRRFVFLRCLINHSENLVEPTRKWRFFSLHIVHGERQAAIV